MDESVKDLFGYINEVAVVTGAASGMGKETAKLLIELGAEVYALDVKEINLPGAKHIRTNLLDKESLHNALQKLPEKIDKIFAIAGMAAGDPVDIVMVNFVGHKYLIENLIPIMSKNGAITIVASTGGMHWMKNLQNVLEFINLSEFDEARVWLEARRNDPNVLGGETYPLMPYIFSKQCLIAYAKMKAWALAEKGIRINTISPGTTRTSMSKDLPEPEELPEEMRNMLVSPIKRYAEPIEQAWTLVFLNSKLASYISGADLPVDFGWTAGVLTGKTQLPMKIEFTG